MDKKRIMKIGMVALVIGLISTGLQQWYVIDACAGGGCGGGCHGGCNSGSGGGGGGGSISDYEIQALFDAIDEEYYAKAVYQKVIDTFGFIQPFYRIRNQEQGHINMIANLLNTYSIPVPSDPWQGQINMEFPTKQFACEVGAQAEFDNAAYYDMVLQGIDNSNIIWTFEHLRDVSRFNHLPTFESWAEYYQSTGE